MIVDIVVAVLVVIAAIRGIQRGATVQVLSIACFFIGLAIGVGLVQVIVREVSGQVAKTFVALLVLLVPAIALEHVGAYLGLRIARTVRRIRLGAVDAVLGAVVSSVGTLVVCWLFASVLINGNYPQLSRQIESSHIIRAVEQVMPPVPNAFASVERYLDSSGFPQVLVNVLPEPTGPVALPGTSAVAQASTNDGPSTVKILALGCGDEQEGSGFIVQTTPNYDLVVTNAHVVAGTSEISVTPQDGEISPALVVLFDPRFDLAVMQTHPLGEPALVVDPSFVERGTSATELGYPEGGPFTADGAGILTRFSAQGRDIYDNELTVRTVYEIQAIVRPGNSGGPLVGPSGEVEGVVFSRSATQSNIGFALASPGVLQRINEVETHPIAAVSTQSCTQ